MEKIFEDKEFHGVVKFFKNIALKVGSFAITGLGFTSTVTNDPARTSPILGVFDYEAQNTGGVGALMMSKFNFRDAEGVYSLTGYYDNIVAEHNNYFTSQDHLSIHIRNFNSNFRLFNTFKLGEVINFISGLSVRGTGDVLAGYGFYDYGVANSGGGTGDVDAYKAFYSAGAVTALKSGGTFFHFYGLGNQPSFFGGIVQADKGFVSTAQEVTPDDSETALNQILSGVNSLDVQAVTNDANDFIVLPPLDEVEVGHTIKVACNAGTNFELRTPASSNEKINAVDSDGTNEYLCVDTFLITLVKISDADGWTAVAQSEVGAPVVPKRYVALITQSSTNAPVATVLENTLGGTVVWTYDAVGKYAFTLNSVFTVNKSIAIMGAPSVGFPDSANFQTDFVDIDYGILYTTDFATNASNGRLSATTFIIEVYP